MKRRFFTAYTAASLIPSLSFATMPAFMVFFNPDSVELSPQAWNTIRQIKSMLPTRMTIMGHTDRAEHDRMPLSLRRASTVRQSLIEIGCSPDFMEVRGYGDQRPLVPLPEGSADPQNRRVEIVTYQ
jgi:OmpA-OmpF porin, OOP family